MRFVQPLAWILTFFIFLFIYTKLFGPIPFEVNSLVTQKSDIFQVTGEGKTIVVPDIALVTLGVESQGSNVKATKDQLNNNANKVIAEVKSQGIDEKDIQTTNYNISPNYDFGSGSQTIKGYIASTNLTIKVREIEKANTVIDAAVANGANQIGGISFDVDDKSQAENTAREKAVAEAKEKAQSAAEIAGFKLGKIINYSENFGGGLRPIPLRAVAETASDEIGSTQIEPGSSEISVTVTLSYEIK